MSSDPLLITVYGREQICASCVGAPGSWDTYEWLQAAIGRKYPYVAIAYEYVDMDEAQLQDEHKIMVERIKSDDLFYPLVLLQDEIIAEGVPLVKMIYKAIEKYDR